MRYFRMLVSEVFIRSPHQSQTSILNGTLVRRCSCRLRLRGEVKSNSLWYSETSTAELERWGKHAAYCFVPVKSCCRGPSFLWLPETVYANTLTFPNESVSF